MVDFVFTVDTTEGERELRVLADQLSPAAVDAALRRYGREWLRRRVRERFEQRPGWPGPAAATKAAAERSAMHRGSTTFRRKLARELRRAKEKLGRVEEPGGYERELARRRLASGGGGRERSLPEVLRARRAAVERRALALAEHDRVAAGGGPEGSLLPGRKGEKQAARLARAIERAAGKPLGRIASSFELVVANGRLTYGSVVPWAGVHDQGGTAGHGARIPARPFAYLEDVDVEVLVAVLVGEGLGVVER